jgi:hypothetical protein
MCGVERADYGMAIRCHLAVSEALQSGRHLQSAQHLRSFTEYFIDGFGAGVRLVGVALVEFYRSPISPQARAENFGLPGRCPANLGSAVFGPLPMLWNEWNCDSIPRNQQLRKGSFSVLSYGALT